MGVNLTGTFNLTRIACKHLITVPPEGPDGERGVVVMVASSAAVRCYSTHPLLFFHLANLIFSSKDSPVKLRMPPPKVHSSV